MNHIRIDEKKAMNKWAPVLENMGIQDEDRLQWMSEYAEYHAINENAYANVSNVAGLGGITAPQVSTLPGTTIGTNWQSNGGTNGSGDLGQNLLPVSMKIAAQTIGLDLVAVKPTPGPKMDLLYIDFQYDDSNLGNTDERPQVFKIDTTASGTTASTLTAVINAVLATYSVIQSVGGLTTISGANIRVFTSCGTSATVATASNSINGSTPFQNTINSGIAANAGKSVATYTTGGADIFTAGSNANLAGVVEFLGFSRIDGFPMFRAYRQANTTQTNSYPYVNYSGTANSNGYGGVNPTTGAQGLWGFDANRNTFLSTTSMVSQIYALFGVFLQAGNFGVSLVSALEDHIPGYVSNFVGGGRYPMDRASEENTYAGQIGPKISSKSIAVGTIEVSSALRRTEIEDIKANTGMDIVQKMESILVNELSQTISKQIVSKIFEMGALNRASAPAYGGTLANISGQTIFDLDTAYAASGPGGETTHAIQRKLITKMVHASNYIATEGRVGPAQFAVTNGALAASLMDIAGYTINPLKSKMNSSGQLYPVGQIGDIQIYVDPYMKYNDNRIVIGRKNNPDQPGIIFVPYLMAQSISIISEATFAPRMLLRSRYAVAEVGWYPQKQFMTLVVNDAAQYLN
jgi:hypothetical protein